MKRSKQISNREREMLHLVAHEYSTKEIAQQLFISNYTVLSHRKNMMTKKGVKNTAGLVRVGFERGWLGSAILGVLMIFSMGLNAQTSKFIEYKFPFSQQKEQIHVLEYEDYYLYEGDIVIEKEKGLGKFLRFNGTWDCGIIPYTFHPNLSTTQIDQISTAIQNINSNSNITHKIDKLRADFY